MCNSEVMQSPDRSPAAAPGNRDRILEVALDLLGERPNAGMGEIAAAAGVVRRTVYGYFPNRDELVHAIAERAADELHTALADVTAASERADIAWVGYVARIWPLARRYRILLVLRRSEHSNDIHEQLARVEQALTNLIRRGQDEGSMGRHLPAALLAQLGQSMVFTLADDKSGQSVDVTAAAITSLLTFGVPESDARALARERIGSPA